MNKDIDEEYLVSLGWVPPEQAEELDAALYQVLEPFRSSDYGHLAAEAVDPYFSVPWSDKEWSEDLWRLVSVYIKFEEGREV